MISPLLIALAGCVVVAICWVLLKMARWSAPVSAAVGFLIAWCGAYLESFRAFGFGGGLLFFSIVLFVIGGGMRGR